MSLENIVGSTKKLTKKLLPLLFASTIFSQPIQSKTPKIEWEREVIYSGYNYSIPFDATQTADGKIILLGRLISRNTAIPQSSFISTVDENGLNFQSKGTLGNLYDRFSPSTSFQGNTLIGNQETISEGEFSEKIIKIDNEGNFSEKEFARNLFNSYFFIEPSKNDLTLIGESYGDNKKLCFAKLDENFNLINSSIKYFENKEVHIVKDTLKVGENLFILSQFPYGFSLSKFDQEANLISETTSQELLFPRRSLLTDEDSNIYFTTKYYFETEGFNFYKFDFSLNPHQDFPKNMDVENEFGELTTSKKTLFGNFLSTGYTKFPNSSNETLFLDYFDKDGKTIWKSHFPPETRRTLNLIQLNDGSFFIMGYKELPNGFIAKISPGEGFSEISPTGFEQRPFVLNKDSFSFSEQEVGEDKISNYFSSLINRILENPLNPTKEKNSLEDYLLLLAPYSEELPLNHSLGMSAASIFFFENFFYGNDGGVIPPRVDTYQRELDLQTRRLIVQEQQKFPIIAFALEDGDLNSYQDVNEIKKILKDKDFPAILISLSDEEEPLSITAFSLEERLNSSTIKIYNPGIPSETQTITFSDEEELIYNGNEVLVLDPSVLSSDLKLKEIIERFKKFYLENLYNSQTSVLTISPFEREDKSSRNYLLTDQNGNRYGNMNNIEYGEIEDVEEFSKSDVTYFRLPRGDYFFSFNSEEETPFTLSYVNSKQNEQSILNFYQIPLQENEELTFISKEEILETTRESQTRIINPTSQEFNKNIYDLNGDGVIDTLDFFSIAYLWKTSSNSSNYNQDFLISLLNQD